MTRLKVSKVSHEASIVFFIKTSDTLQSCHPPEVTWMAWHPQIVADQLTVSQPGEADYDYHINTGTPGYSYLPTALKVREFF